MLNLLLRCSGLYLLMVIFGGCSSIKLIYKIDISTIPMILKNVCLAKLHPGKGTYTLDRGIQLLDKANIQFEGSGSTLIMNSKSPVRNGYCIFNLRDCKNLSFSNFALDANRQGRGCAESYAHSFIMAGCQFINLSNTTIENSVADGIFLAAGTERDSSTFASIF